MKKSSFANILIVLWLVFFFQKVYSQKEGIVFIDSLKEQLPKVGSDTNKVRTLAELSYSLYNYNLEEGVNAGKKALKLAQELHYNSGIAVSRLSLSYCYFYQSNIPMVIDNLLEAEPIFIKSGDIDRLCATYIILAAANGRFDSVKMVEYYFKAKSLWWKTKSDKLRFSTLSWIHVMSRTIEPDSSDKYFSLLLKIAENHNTPEYLARKYSMLAYIYENEKNFDSGFYYRNLALPLFLKLENKRNLAESYYEVARKYWKGNNARTKNYITRQKAMEYFNLCISISKEYGEYTFFVVSSYAYLYKMQKDQGQLKQALFSLEQYDTYNQKMISIENASESAALTWKNEKKIQEKEVELLHKQNKQKLKIIIIGTIGIFLMLILIIVVIIVWRKNIKLKRREMDHQIVTLEQKALQSMMNPHFIFNSLGSIQNYLLQKKTSEAGLYLSQFARLIRQNLNAINAAMINLDEETDRLKNYLDLEKMRLPDRFDYTIEIDEAIESDETYLPSMIVQPFIENSIWHGISPMEEIGHVKVLIQKESEYALKITVEDNGIGMKKSELYSQKKKEEHLRLSLEMTRKRLHLLGLKFKVDTRIDFYEAFPGAENPGTKVEIVLPFKYNANAD